MRFDRLFESKAESTAESKAESKAECGAYFTVVMGFMGIEHLMFLCSRAVTIVWSGSIG